MPNIFAQFVQRLRPPGLNKDKASETPRPKAPVLLLPTELTLMILRHLDRIDTICLALTCKDLKNAWLKPQKHPKYLPTYKVSDYEGVITYSVYLERKQRFWELWRIYSERWELLRRLARDSPRIYDPCFGCLKLHWKGLKGRTPNSGQKNSKPQPLRHGRGFAEFPTTYAALESVVFHLPARSNAHRGQADAGQVREGEGGPGFWNCVCAIATVRRDKRDFRKLLENVWANTPYGLGESSESDHLKWYRDWRQWDTS